MHFSDENLNIRFEFKTGRNHPVNRKKKTLMCVLELSVGIATSTPPFLTKYPKYGKGSIYSGFEKTQDDTLNILNVSKNKGTFVFNPPDCFFM